MRLFDIQPYELPKYDTVDWLQTKYAIGIFLRTYKTNRERMGYSQLPRLSQSVEIVTGKQIREVWPTEAEKKQFEYTEACFNYGFSAIMHAYRPEVSERRRKIFFYRYLYGLSVPLISDRINYQKNIIIDESKLSIIQFSQSLDLLVVTSVAQI
ncbi:hypothetical protein IGI37_000600 [Enterococcus sp. AZ194]|uniref:transcriptional regulator, ArpU family protein n=1 Tax=Enterococcus sp. AZ194 TaxID=2774629 RepID=UPI003F221DB9